MKAKGFTLLELAVTTAVIGLLAMVVVPSLAERLETARLEAESQVLAELTTDVKRSFSEASGLRNLATFTDHGTTQNKESITRFSEVGVSPAVSSDGDWFSKIGRLRGIVPENGGELSAESQQALHHLAFNSYGRSRWVIAGPEEPGQQRYLVLSLMAPATRPLVVPRNDGSAAWFDGIWNNAWEGGAATLPGDWANRLTAEEVAAWAAGRGTTTLVRCLVVQRLVQPKYRLTVNNTHPVFSAWVDYEGVANKVVSAPGSGVISSEEILAGRMIVVRRGITEPGTEVYRFYLNEPTSVTVQQ